MYYYPLISIFKDAGLQKVTEEGKHLISYIRGQSIRIKKKKKDIRVSVTVVVEGKISYFGLARNLIRHLISPNRDDLSYSARNFFSGQQIGKSAKPALFGWRTPSSADVTLAVLQ